MLKLTVPEDEEGTAPTFRGSAKGKKKSQITMEVAGWV